LAAYFLKSEVTRFFWFATNMPFEASIFIAPLFGPRAAARMRCFCWFMGPSSARGHIFYRERASIDQRNIDRNSMA